MNVTNFLNILCVEDDTMLAADFYDPNNVIAQIDHNIFLRDVPYQANQKPIKIVMIT